MAVVKPPQRTRLTILEPHGNEIWEPDLKIVGIDVSANAATVDVSSDELPNGDVTRWNVVFSHDGEVYNGYIQAVESRYGKQRLGLILDG